jgi:hypothetical protein
MKIVKCKRCGTEWEMPDIIGIDIAVMEDCPVCRELDATMKRIGLNKIFEASGTS